MYSNSDVSAVIAVCAFNRSADQLNWYFASSSSGYVAVKTSSIFLKGE